MSSTVTTTHAVAVEPEATQRVKEEWVLRRDNVERNTAVSESRIALVFFFDCIIFICVALLSFLDLGLPDATINEDSSIPGWWYIMYVHLCTTFSNLVLLFLFFLESGRFDTMEARFKLSGHYTIATLQPLVLENKYYVFPYIMYALAIVGDGIVYGVRFANSVKCSLGETEHCVFVNSGVFWEWWGVILGISLFFLDCGSWAYCAAYKNAAECEYDVKRRIMSDAKNPYRLTDGDSAVVAPDPITGMSGTQFTNPSLRRRSRGRGAEEEQPLVFNLSQ